jgi:lysine 6-dehydrogenase
VVDHARIVKVIRDSSVVVCALPQKLAVAGDTAAIDAGVNVVDIAFEDDQVQLHSRLVEKGLTLISGCGLAPGLTNILSRRAVDELDKAYSVYIKVGGIPQNPQPPLEYRVVFSLETVWDEYLKPARIIREGHIQAVPALSGLETVNFPQPFGRMECFYTDGLSTLIHTMKGRVRELEEKTVRYPGHAEKIETLIECGLLQSEPIAVGDTQITPRRFLTALLTPKLELGDEKDATLMRVDVTGEKDRRKVKYTYQMVDLFDMERGITSMARTTAFPGMIVALMLARGEIGGKGLVPPEDAITEDAFEKYIAELHRRGVHVAGPSVRACSSTSSF